MFKASPDLTDFINFFKYKFITLFIAAFAVVTWKWIRIYGIVWKYIDLTACICLIVSLLLALIFTTVISLPDLKLVNCIVSEFSIDKEYITLTTIPVKIPLITNKLPIDLKLKRHEFSRNKTIYPIRILYWINYSSWELRTEETSMYVITKFFSDEAINNLEEFLYWKNIVEQNA